MNPCELNAIIAAISNKLFVSLPKDDFYLLSVIFSELSKSMFSMSLFKGILDDEKKKGIK